MFQFPSVGDERRGSIYFDFQALGTKDANLGFLFLNVGDRKRKNLRLLISKHWGWKNLVFFSFSTVGDERIYVFWFPRRESILLFDNFWGQKNLSISKRCKIFLTRCLRSTVFCLTILGDRIYMKHRFCQPLKKKDTNFPHNVPTSLTIVREQEKSFDFQVLGSWIYPFQSIFCLPNSW